MIFLLMGSLLLPLKAVLINMLSISASYGTLVWIFQYGHLAAWLHFTPGPIETMTPIIMFCILFGLSMDYEVLLLSRVREEFERTGDNTRAVAESLERTGRLITGAAAIMASVLFAFGLADMVVIKAMGIGMGIAVVVDATIVRALLVPATMRPLGRWNWWAPGSPVPPSGSWGERTTSRSAISSIRVGPTGYHDFRLDAWTVWPAALNWERRTIYPNLFISLSMNAVSRRAIPCGVLNAVPARLT